MASSVLIAYATKYGSTREVAEAVAKRLRERGLTADVKPAREVRSLDGFDAVVLGTPLYIGSMLKDATALLEGRRSELERMPVAVFALGPITAEQASAEGRSQLDSALAKTPWLSPAASELFVGKYDPAKLRFLDKLIAVLPASPLHDVPAQDARDWAAIDAWADGLPSAMGLSG
ncbi:MAG TPA: flavodoxin domain-containing protein [Coriobacteriia bacterium]|jgi:menaquinone-dependent protoporphyrinogen oxidase